MFKKLAFFSLVLGSLQGTLFFSPEMTASHLKTYTDEEKVLIEKDLAVVRSVCMSSLPPQTTQPVYLATAGAPGSRKTTILERFLSSHPEYASGAYLDPDPRALRYMVHTYYQTLSPLNISNFSSYSKLIEFAYTKWRGGSNYIALTLLEEAFATHRTVIHGTTSTGDHMPAFYAKLKEAGYKIVLLLCASDDEFRKKAITYRNEVVGFYQNSPEDAVSKGRLFTQKMAPFFQLADTLYLYWSDDLKSPEQLAAIFEKGRMEVRDRAAFEKFKDKYEQDRALSAQEGKQLPAFDELIGL